MPRRGLRAVPEAPIAEPVPGPVGPRLVAAARLVAALQVEALQVEVELPAAAALVAAVGEAVLAAAVSD